MEATLRQLHLGCGPRHIPGFIHVDLCDLPHIDYKHRADSLPMFEDHTIDLIYASHVFEYFDRLEAAEVLKEYRRVLKSDGLLRLAVPDFEALIEVYRRTGDISRVLGPLYGRMQINGGTAQERWLYHKTVYDFASLQGMLEANGFERVRRYDWTKTVHKDHDDCSQAYFPHMDKEHGLLISLNVEAEPTKDSL
jgi:predicted SAM-dependent methyltransferase